MPNTPPTQNQTQPAPTPKPIDTPPTTQTNSTTPNKKKPWLLISLIVLLFGVSGAFAYKYFELKQQVDNQSQSIPLPSPQVVVSSPSPVVSPATEVGPTVEWKMYKDNTYSFKYPSTWTVQPGTPEAEERYWSGGDFVEIIAPTPTVTIDISPGQSTYGFALVERKKGETLNIFINGKTYEGTEDIRVEAGKTKVFVDMMIPVNNEEFHVLFGTGYPVNQDDAASYSDYLNYRDTIVQLLSTLKINN